MKVETLANNQVTISDDNFLTFVSYESIICRITKKTGLVELDEKFYNFSKTTSKYRNRFLDLDTKTIEKKIVTGEFILTNLN